jgi:hypothetical protein
MADIIPMQIEFDRHLVPVFGNKEYQDELEDLDAISNMIKISDLDYLFMQHFLDLKDKSSKKPLTINQSLRLRKKASLCFEPAFSTND